MAGFEETTVLLKPGGSLEDCHYKASTVYLAHHHPHDSAQQDKSRSKLSSSKKRQEKHHESRYRRRRSNRHSDAGVENVQSLQRVMLLVPIRSHTNRITAHGPPRNPRAFRRRRDSNQPRAKRTPSKIAINDIGDIDRSADALGAVRKHADECTADVGSVALGHGRYWRDSETD